MYRVVAVKAGFMDYGDLEAELNQYVEQGYEIVKILTKSMHIGWGKADNDESIESVEWPDSLVMRDLRREKADSR